MRDDLSGQPRDGCMVNGAVNLFADDGGTLDAIMISIW
jgi:hypothetical protein